MSQVKQVIVIRADLLKGVPRGKIWAQAAHAGRDFLIRILRNFITSRGKLPEIPLFTEAEVAWITGDRTTVCLTCEGEEEMLALHQAALDAGVRSYVMTDLGHTVFKEATNTAISLGPDFADRLDPITKNGPVLTRLA